jgi:hypothetical protein
MMRPRKVVPCVEGMMKFVSSYCQPSFSFLTIPHWPMSTSPKPLSLAVIARSIGVDKWLGEFKGMLGNMLQEKTCYLGEDAKDGVF